MTMGHAGSPPAYENQAASQPQSFTQQQAQTPQPIQPQPTHYSSQHQVPQQNDFQTYAQPAQTGPHPIPLHALHDQPAWVNCPICHVTQMTRIEFVSGTTTHLWALALCCCLCLGCIPYCVSGLKDAQHHCGQCGAMLATYKRGSGVEVNPGAVGGQQAPQQAPPQKA